MVLMHMAPLIAFMARQSFTGDVISYKIYSFVLNGNKSTRENRRRGGCCIAILKGLRINTVFKIITVTVQKPNLILFIYLFIYLFLPTA
jgi:hypothetical protein